MVSKPPATQRRGHFWASAWITAVLAVGAGVLGFWVSMALRQEDTEALESPLVMAVWRRRQTAITRGDSSASVSSCLRAIDTQKPRTPAPTARTAVIQAEAQKWPRRWVAGGLLTMKLPPAVQGT